MRIIGVILLALVALGAGGMWALAEFGGNHEVMVAEEVTPVAREEVAPAPAAAPEPTPAAPASPPESAPSKPAKIATAPVPRAAPAPTPVAPPAAEVAPAAAPTPAPAEAAAPTETAAAAPAPTPTQSAASKLLRPSFDSSPSKPAAPAPVAPVQAAPAPAAAPTQTATAAPEPTVSSASAPKPETKTAAAKTVAPASAPAAAAQVAPAAASLADQFKTRKIAYNRPPTTLILDRPIDISLVIDATAAPEAAAALQGFPGTIVERDVELSDIVSAQLTGVGFDITSQTVERQKLSPRTQNRWQWRVTPTETGTRTLILQIYGYESGSLEAEPLDSYRDDIKVEVKQLDQVITFAKKIQPVFAVIAAIAGACSAMFAFLKFRNDRKKA